MDRIAMLVLCCAMGASSGESLEASAVILTDAAWKAGGSGSVMGTVYFSQAEGSDTVKVSGSLTNLRPEGLHGFHIHVLGDLEGGCAAAKGHFNPFNKLHGGPKDAERHVGDLGNIRAGADGSSTIDISDVQIQLHGAQSIVGRSVVVHQLADDLGRGVGDKEAESKKTGNAGKRLACGVIGMKSGPFNGASARGSSNVFYVVAAFAVLSLCWQRRR